MTVPTPPLKLIEWEDAWSGLHEWTKVNDLADTAPALIISTVGFEIRRDAERVTLTMSYGDDGHEPRCCDVFTIPVGMIRREIELM